MLRRLRDAGYPNLAGSDLHDHLEEPGIPLTICDLNEDFAHEFGIFECIIASEVIEHLNDPRHFLSECHNILTDGGIIVVSTPNIAFFEGRIKFLLKGELWGYGAHNYAGQRHISAISQEQFPLLFEECGFEQIAMTTAGSFATRLRKMLTSPIWLIMRAALGKHVIGESLICVARKRTVSTDRLSSAALWGAKSRG